jgi:hypothetical protein
MQATFSNACDTNLPLENEAGEPYTMKLEKGSEFFFVCAFIKREIRKIDSKTAISQTSDINEQLVSLSTQ